MDYQNLFLFVTVAEQGSYIKAADHLKMPTSTLSRRIQQLEEQLGYQLLYRSARKLTLTEAGTLFYRRCQPLYSELTEATQGVDSELTSPTGELRVTAPVSLANALLNAWFFEFMELHPGIHLDLMLVNRNVDLKAEGVDIAFRIGDIKIRDWICRPLFTSRFSLCASRELILKLGHPETLDDLRNYPLIMSRSSPSWNFHDREGRLHTFSAEPRLRIDELSAAAESVEAGLGIANLPDYVVGESLTYGRMVTVLPLWQPIGREVQLLYPHRQYLPAKVRLFISFIMDKVEQERAALSA
ncbi:LysR family transcriptional regulator [uncultured Neptuniibacter sp.]|uniref:LysR family transcriptional regulator n=1 Tax=uncultured Neptuniibacter sp. TaxID=502143 RepID=UPI0026118E74|nr:LysR family transcriptional regulator [uncultured Neptuniibacter sp.]